MSGKKVMLTIQGESIRQEQVFCALRRITAMRIRMILFWYCTIGDCGN